MVLLSTKIYKDKELVEFCKIHGFTQQNFVDNDQKELFQGVSRRYKSMWLRVQKVGPQNATGDSAAMQHALLEIALPDLHKLAVQRFCMFLLFSPRHKRHVGTL